VLGIPTDFYNVGYEDVKLLPTRIEAIRGKIAKAPSAGVLLVSGTAAPIINQLLDMKNRKVVGIDFVEYYNSKLSSENTIELPKASIILLYNVGLEPANNATFAGKILSSIMSMFRSSLLIIETDKTPSSFITTYGISIVNSLIIPTKDIEKWV
jgi:hypothetical protein